MAVNKHDLIFAMKWVNSLHFQILRHHYWLSQKWVTRLAVCETESTHRNFKTEMLSINQGLIYGCENVCINKGRFCNTIASVALVHTSIQCDLRMQTKEILSSKNSKQMKPQSCPETSTPNSRFVRTKGGF